MLDNENDGVTTAEETTPTAPVRRRRAAARPAGPPQDAAAEPTTGSPTAEPEAADLTPKRRRVATKPDAAAAPVRRRRVKAVEASSEDAPAAVAPVEGAPAAEAPVVETPAAEATPSVDESRPVRRRATRRTAPPAPIEPTPTLSPVESADAPAPVEESSATTPIDEQPPEAAAQQTPAPAPVRRRRASRPAAAPEPVVPAEPVVAPEPVAAAEPTTAPEPEAAPQPALVPAETTTRVASEAAPTEEAGPTSTRSRRRRASRPAAAPATLPEGQDEDAIGAALRAAEEVAEARRALLTDPFLTAAAREQQLAALAGAIAGSPTEEDEAEPEGEDGELTEAATDEAAAEPAEDEPETDEDDSDDAVDDESDDDRPSRRRRRRGGRRRRRGGSRDGAEDSESDSDEADEAESEAPAEEPAEGEPDADGAEQDTAEADDNGTTRRRRRRRRRGEGADADSTSSDEVTGIEGSTRMEAKRQRRKESRAAGRRRAPILSEAEFLTRREAVDRRLVIRQSEDYTQLAVVEDNILVEHYVDKASATSLIGNIYVGRIQNVLPSMEAAFIDIGRGRNAVLYAGEVDWANFGVTGENRKVENVLKSGQSVLVQVTKDPVGAKGARLTGHISLPGRYIVYSPGGHLSGISRKLPDTERSRLRTILGSLISEDESVIVRTAAEGASEEELIRDVNRLKAQWEVIEKKTKQGSAPQALYSEPDLTLRIVRDLFTEDFGQLIVQGDGGPADAYDAISAYVSHVAPHLAERLVRFEPAEDGRDVFSQFKIDEQIAKALDRKVFLPSGGSLVIDRTEAMTVVDVNTGRFTGTGGNLEATVTSNNLEAAEEIVRQLRLRDIGGIIVIDFIDMVLPSNRELLLRRLVECLGRDRTRHQVAEVTSLGLVQLTRKRIGTGLAEAFTEPCEHCQGAGYVRFEEPVDSQAPSDGGERRSPRRRGKK
ncbi:Rne/Rng family ribonuclease [Tessaracoccus sp. MC1627]|uniref:Rne/Rng family ribonuclease n=1 Tax=Tessaracoccus sp. MC1627 TaxID=2760312 RepID=UPI0016023E95|nr:Rne/Rng family ribonuclease [Tessaracoccus sp. MC1627]MBB1513707.1 Rne/Rng family ribonuclease [Tessaracoccus sp. MC1627]